MFLVLSFTHRQWSHMMQPPARGKDKNVFPPKNRIIVKKNNHKKIGILSSSGLYKRVYKPLTNHMVSVPASNLSEMKKVEDDF